MKDEREEKPLLFLLNGDEKCEFRGCEGALNALFKTASVNAI